MCNSLHVASLGSQVKGSLVLVIPEVQMLHLQPHIFPLIILFLKRQPFSCCACPIMLID